MAEAIQTTKFGKIEYGESDVILVQDGLPGFTSLRRFLLIESEEFAPIKFFQSLDDPIISFPLIDPTLVRANYEVRLSQEQRVALGMPPDHAALAYSIVTLGHSVEDASANLFAPLVINTSKMRASQVILLDSDYSVAEPLLRG
jgi:flagellar assembly factor FliW